MEHTFLATCSFKLTYLILLSYWIVYAFFTPDLITELTNNTNQHAREQIRNTAMPEGQISVENLDRHDF
jgi:hypothetical protein